MGRRKTLWCRLISAAGVFVLAMGSMAGCGAPKANETTVANEVEQEMNQDETGNAASTENKEELSVTEEVVSEETKEPDSIELVMVGDMLMHMTVVEKGQLSDGSYDFNYLFDHVRTQIEEADIAIVNQETILGGTELGIKGYPCFNSPYEVGDAEANAGFDVILHATNHALDVGKAGLLNCMNFWEETYPDIAYLGIHKSKEAQDDNIFYWEQNGIRIAILNYTYGTNGIATPSDMPYAVDYLDEDKVTSDLQKADENADFVVVCPHWGTEYSLEVSSEQEYWTRIFLENGVDLVIGTHPHVIEPIEWVTDDAGNQMLVYDSLGNYVNSTSGTGPGTSNRMVGGMADVTIGRDDSGNVIVEDYGVIPLVCHWGEEEVTTYYLEDYTTELAAQNHILQQDSEFSVEYCENLIRQIWDEEQILSPKK